MRNPAILFAPLAVAAATAVAGPFDEPYTIITTDTFRAADPDLRPVFVNRVDGENVLDGRAVVPPGRKVVVLDLAPRMGYALPTQRTFEFDAQPCVRYFLAAKLDNEIAQNWEPVIRRREGLGECRKKFGIAPPAKAARPSPKEPS